MSSIVSARSFAEHRELLDLVEHQLAAVLGRVADRLVETLRSGNTILFCGNGGSAADSQHLAAEFSGRFRRDRRPLSAVALTTDSSALTCIANDFGFEEVFARQVEAVGRKNDTLVVISTSGSSENVLRALRIASRIGIKTVALLGKGGGDARALADEAIVIPSESTARIQEMHILLGHLLCEHIEDALGFGDTAR